MNLLPHELDIQPWSCILIWFLHEWNISMPKQAKNVSLHVEINIGQVLKQRNHADLQIHGEIQIWSRINGKEASRTRSGD